MSLEDEIHYSRHPDCHVVVFAVYKCISSCCQPTDRSTTDEATAEARGAFCDASTMASVDVRIEAAGSVNKYLADESGSALWAVDVGKVRSVCCS